MSIPFTRDESQSIKQVKVADYFMFERVFGRSNVPLDVMLESYMSGVGSCFDDLRYESRKRIDAAASRLGIIRVGESIFDRDNQPSRDVLLSLCPGLDGHLFDAIHPDSIRSYQVLLESDTEWGNICVPSRVDMILHRTKRPSVYVRSLKNVDVYAGPFGYQVYNKRENFVIPSASPTPLPRSIVAAPHHNVPGNIVIVQDRFDGTNFAHFLYDYVTRIGLFIESNLCDIRNSTFLMGGIPGRFHEILINAIASLYSVSITQFLFPKKPVNLVASEDVYWFSDQVEFYMHPSQMAHPRSLSVIQKISLQIPIEPSPKNRIYISRGDAERRRVSNEGAIADVLERNGFETVIMSNHSIDAQIALVRGAKIVIGPHGMAFTLTSLSLETPAIVEFHNPTVGSDDYAVMAAANGSQYRCLVGVPTSGASDDYSVSPQEVAAYIRSAAAVPDFSTCQEPIHKETNIIISSSNFSGRWCGGTQETPAVESKQVPALFRGSSVLRHVRSDPETYVDTNVGFWWGLAVEAGETYTASCWVWIPREFGGHALFLGLGEWPGQVSAAANLEARDVWQRISTVCCVPPGVSEAALVLRVDGSQGAAVWSTGWQVEQGEGPSMYIPTLADSSGSTEGP